MGETARLCRIVEGVEFTVDEQGVIIRGLILRDALEVFFGADETPASWLLAYSRYRDVIDCAAADRYRADLGPSIVVLRADRPEDFRIGAPAKVVAASARYAV